MRGHFTTAEVVETIDSAIRAPDYEPGFDIRSEHSAVGAALTRAGVLSAQPIGP